MNYEPTFLTLVAASWLRPSSCGETASPAEAARHPGRGSSNAPSSVKEAVSASRQKHRGRKRTTPTNR